MLPTDVNMIVKWLKLSKRKPNHYYNVVYIKIHFMPLLRKTRTSLYRSVLIIKYILDFVKENTTKVMLLLYLTYFL